MAFTNLILLCKCPLVGEMKSWPGGQRLKYDIVPYKIYQEGHKQKKKKKGVLRRSQARRCWVAESSDY